MFRAIVLLYLLSTYVTADIRCGSTWADAHNNCNNKVCKNNGDCPSGRTCFANVKSCTSAVPPPPVPPSFDSKTTTRCGATWQQANSGCGKDCTTDKDCPGTSCWTDLKSCGGSTPPPPVNPPTNPTTPSNGGCGYRVSNEQLATIMGRSGQDLNRFIAPLNNALARYGMDCPDRITAFLSQIHHETAGLSIFHQPADNGVGSLHMTPSNWGFACQAIPEIRNAFAQRFSNCGNCECTNSPSADVIRGAVEIFSDPVNMWLSGAWWFAEGAKIPAVFGFKGCGDLRLEADKGLGAAGGSDCQHTGYYQITCCIFWTINGAAGLPQRLTYYNLAKSVIGGSRALADGDKSFAATTPVDQMLTPAQIAGIVLGCVAVVVVVVVVAVLAVNGKKQTPPTEERI